MSYRVIVQPQANNDAETIYAWLWKRAVDGANNWYRAFLIALSDLRDDPLRHTHAPEARKRRGDLYQHFFKTKCGRRYRLVYVVEGDEVIVLRVRGPGQAPLRKREI